MKCMKSCEVKKLIELLIRADRLADASSAFTHTIFVSMHSIIPKTLSFLNDWIIFDRILHSGVILLITYMDLL